MTESGVPPEAWTDDAAGRAALAWLIEHHAALGWSAKDSGGWEPLLPGDQLLTTAASPLRLRGRFRTWTIEDGGAAAAGGGPPPGGAVRRLRYLRDTAGGCSPGFDAFRRLNLTWHPTAAERARLRAALTGRPAEPTGAPVGDAPNRLNSHVLHVEASQSRTHYHPAPPVGGGRAQCELYFALDRVAYGLQAPPAAPARLYTFPDRQHWARYASTELTPGTAVFIPPGVGHRAVDAFVNVVTIPGFKPRNEIYVDRLIRAAGGGAPCNPGAA
jgi:hypothetical protein